MNIKTLLLFVLTLLICCSGCAAEIAYWTKKMEENKEASDEENKTEGAQAEGAKVVASSQPPTSAPPVTLSPVEWPPREQTPTHRASEIQAPAPEPAPVTPAKDSFTINLKGGDKYVGEILHETITFNTNHGPIKVKLGNLTSFSQGSIKMEDGTNVKGAIGQSTIKIKTPGLGEVKIQADDIESITK